MPTSGSTGSGTIGALCERLYEGFEIAGDVASNRDTAAFEWSCPADELLDEITNIKGTMQVYTSTWGGSVSRRLPMAHPDFPDLYATSYRVDGMGRADANRLYSWYKIRCQFETLPYQAAGDTPFVSISRSFGTRWVTRPGRYLKMATSNFVLEHDQATPIPTMMFAVTIHGSAGSSFTALKAATAAPVNSSTLYLPGGLTVAAGYARFDGEDQQADLSYGGNVAKVVGLKFAVQDKLRWDQIFDPSTGLADYPLAPDGSRVVLSSNLNNLFL